MSFYLWDDTCENWDTHCVIWDQCERIVDDITKGATRTPEEAWDAYKQLNKKKKKRIIRLVLYLKGEKIIQEKEIENYEVTVSDIKMITEEYKKRKEEKIKINVSNIEFS